eukprot:TRINITY_DN3620_c0_g2_i6.p1 TRINITY_DN3620_c0_g2~~TRINITY_DN3620_c0_g2_i6.p1  ORF type:complete len:172 (-),score=12.17 TRINITY_DN3620_c0_g2_i6:686-1201(-)
MCIRDRSNCTANVNESCKTIMKSLTHLHSLIHLTLDFTSTSQLNDEGCNHVGQVVNHFSSTLATLHLNFYQCEQITDAGVDHIAGRLSSLSKLIHLHLNYTHCGLLTDRSVENIVNGVKILSGLTQLSLLFYGLQLSDGPVASLTRVLRNLTQLKQLSIGWSSNRHHHRSF